MHVEGWMVLVSWMNHQMIMKCNVRWSIKTIKTYTYLSGIIGLCIIQMLCVFTKAADVPSCYYRLIHLTVLMFKASGIATIITFKWSCGCLYTLLPLLSISFELVHCILIVYGNNLLYKDLPLSGTGKSSCCILLPEIG